MLYWFCLGTVNYTFLLLGQFVIVGLKYVILLPLLYYQVVTSLYCIFHKVSHIFALFEGIFRRSKFCRAERWCCTHGRTQLDLVN